MLTVALLGTDRREPPPPAAGLAGRPRRRRARDPPRRSGSSSRPPATTVLRRAGIRPAAPQPPFAAPARRPAPDHPARGHAHLAPDRRRLAGAGGRVAAGRRRLRPPRRPGAGRPAARAPSHRCRPPRPGARRRRAVGRMARRPPAAPRRVGSACAGPGVDRRAGRPADAAGAGRRARGTGADGCRRRDGAARRAVARAVAPSRCWSTSRRVSRRPSLPVLAERLDRADPSAPSIGLAFALADLARLRHRMLAELERP